MLMHSPLYAAILALLIIKLSFNVIGLRRANKISLGDDNHPELRVAIRAHANATEYIPIALILLFAAELQGIHWSIIHAFGGMFTLGRFIHAFGLPLKTYRWRVVSMQLTITVIFLLAVINLVCIVARLLGNF